MGLEVRVAGAHQLEALARRLREAGDRSLPTELRRALSKAAKPLEADVRAHVGLYLPNRYAAVLERSMKFAVSVRTSGRSPSVTIVFTAKGVRHERQIKTLDNPGLLRHPVFARGPRRTWHWARKPQRVRPGFWSDQVEDHKPRIRRDMHAAMHDVAEKITKG